MPAKLLAESREPGPRLVGELVDETARTLSKPIQAVNVQKAKRA
jgi:hypothetical protein